MKKSQYIVLGALVVMFFGTSLSVFAHDGVEHNTHGEAMLHEAPSLQQMEELIVVLKELIRLLQTKIDSERTNRVEGEMQSSINTKISNPPYVKNEQVSPESNDEVYTVRHEDAQTTEKLVIEVEEHHGSTHVHVRYVDKPESMFFIEVPLTNREGIEQEIVRKTGLSESVVRDALIFLNE
jgi:hypothetical protein